MKISNLSKTLEVLFKADITPMIVGHHGIGKSSAIKEYAKNHDMECVVVRLGNMVDAGDLLGLGDFVKDEKGQSIATKFFAPDWWPRDPDSKGIIFLDEINRIKNPSILQAVFGLAEPRFIGGRKLHTHVLPDGWSVVAAANPPTDDYDVIDIKDAAFVDRFCYLKLENTPKQHQEYMGKKEFHRGLVAFCVEHEKLMYPSLQDFSLEFVKPSNRSIEMVDLVLKQNPDEETLNHILYGLIGTEATVVYKRFMEESYNVVEAYDIVHNFSKVEKRLVEIIEKKRLDIVTMMTDNLLAFLEKHPDITAKPMQNVKKFLNMVPKDIKWGFNYAASDKLNGEILEKLTEIYES